VKLSSEVAHAYISGDTVIADLAPAAADGGDIYASSGVDAATDSVPGAAAGADLQIVRCSAGVVAGIACRAGVRRYGRSRRLGRLLVREAFGLMGFANNLVENRIFLIAPDGEKTVGRIKACCPGMAKGQAGLEDMVLPDVIGRNADPADPAFTGMIRDIIRTSEYNYFAVAGLKTGPRLLFCAGKGILPG